MNTELTEIIFVLDKSGSMHSVVDDTIGGFNQFLKDQQEIPGEAVFTFIEFDHRYQVLETAELLENVQNLTNETYKPSGSTALLDAVGRTINETVNRHAELPDSKRPGKVMLVVLTDGEENSSREYRELKEIAAMVGEREDAGWDVLFLGADIDAWADGGKMGFSKAVSMNKSDMLGNMTKMSYYAATYRSAGKADMDAFNMTDDELKKNISDLKSK